ncbi:MAG: LemA family protein [Actinomycetota bacterium]|nr:LemA family protein [Actinomycetota bacterium]
MRVAGAVAAGLLVAAVSALGAMHAATRLDRLHVRTDAAWAALDAALRRRALMLGELDGAAAMNGAAGVALRAETDVALQAVAEAGLQAGAHAAREEMENEVGRVLAVLDLTGLDPARAGQLADAQQRVVIARRIYNDAVRDTLALRSHRTVRWLRLAGRAPLPRYFEIAEPVLAGYGLELDGAGA